jgi:hypothetical protein
VLEAHAGGEDAGTGHAAGLRVTWIGGALVSEQPGQWRTHRGIKRELSGPELKFGFAQSAFDAPQRPVVPEAVLERRLLPGRNVEQASAQAVGGMAPGDVHVEPGHAVAREDGCERHPLVQSAEHAQLGQACVHPWQVGHQPDPVPVEEVSVSDRGAGAGRRLDLD